VGVRRPLVALVALVMVGAGLATAAAVAREGVINAVPPAIAGKAEFGQVLHATPGSWEPAPTTVAYQWLRDGQAIKGATQGRYRIGLDDLGRRLSVRVDASDGVGTGTATSAPSARVTRAPLVSEMRPRVYGDQRYGRTVTADAGSWSNRPTRVRFQWLRDGKPIRGATRARYRFVPADVGERLRVKVTASRPGFTKGTKRSSRTAPVGHRVGVHRSVTYSIATRGRITASLAKFRAQAAETYADPRGWRGGGVQFRRVRHGGSFTLVLASASAVPTFSPVCSSRWSCRVGRYVIINQDRWLHASPAWNAAGRSLRDYRHMVVNHETGHWLGRGHASCPRPGRLAPVMMQQSKGTGGCRFNPWPTLRELSRR
jgi:hypothetical protein